jgi:AcrR family transcriptional regulator
MDARQARSRRLLHDAVLELATTTDVAELTVTRVAEAAGVQRSTFYAHATDPPALLRSALLEELDALRAELLDDPDRPAAEAAGRTTRRVAQHVRDHAEIYRRGLADDAGAGSLHAMLSDHFLTSGRGLLARDRVRLPLPRVAGVAARRLDDAAARFVAQGTVGVLRTWLELPGRPSVPAFERMYATLLPTWWVQHDGTGDEVGPPG